MRRPIGVLKTTTYETITSANDSQIIRFRCADRRPEELQVRRSRGCFTFGIVGDADRDVLAVVELEEEVAGDPEREEVDRRPADDLVGAQVDREERVHERHQAAREHRDQRARRPSCPLLSAP